MNTFILSDESVNSYGFRILSNGVDITRFKSNPVMLGMHNGNMLPIGRWENIRLENGQWLAEPVFDEADPVALEYKGKVERGFLKAASVGVDILEWSDDRSLLLQGQKFATATKSSFFEASLVPVGSNANALKLNFPSKGIQLSGGFDDKLLELSLPRVQENGNQADKLNEMESVKLKLGLSKEADEKAVLEALNAKLSENKGPSDREIEILMGLGREKGFIDDANEATYKNLSKADFDSVLGLIQSAKKAELKADTKEEEKEDKGRFSDLIAQLGAKLNGGANDRSKWTLGDWMEKDEAGLLKLKEEKPDQYAALTKAYYGRAV